jgi:hypothetical protein
LTARYARGFEKGSCGFSGFQPCKTTNFKVAFPKTEVLGKPLFILFYARGATNSYAASLSFASCFMPVYGVENGLRGSNAGQILLLNGLFAILLAPLFAILFQEKYQQNLLLPLALNARAIYLFSLNMSAGILIIVIFIGKGGRNNETSCPMVITFPRIAARGFGKPTSITAASYTIPASLPTSVLQPDQARGVSAPRPWTTAWR